MISNLFLRNGQLSSTKTPHTISFFLISLILIWQNFHSGVNVDLAMAYMVTYGGLSAISKYTDTRANVDMEKFKSIRNRDQE